MLFAANLLASTKKTLKKQHKIYKKPRLADTHTQPFYGSVEFVRENPGEPVPEETFTHLADIKQKPMLKQVVLKLHKRWQRVRGVRTNLLLAAAVVVVSPSSPVSCTVDESCCATSISFLAFIVSCSCRSFSICRCFSRSIFSRPSRIHAGNWRRFAASTPDTHTPRAGQYWSTRRRDNSHTLMTNKLSCGWHS